MLTRPLRRPRPLLLGTGTLSEPFLPRAGEEPDAGSSAGGPGTDGKDMLGMRTAGLPDCRPLLADPDDLSLVFQPIVDLAAATVADYEALARFPGVAGPDVWFAAAAEAGIAAELEALAIHKALAAVPSLPPDTFLTVNVSPTCSGRSPSRTRWRSARTCTGSSSSSPSTPRARPRRAAPADRRAAPPGRPHRPGRCGQRLLPRAAGQRALTRPPAHRFEPILCTDPTGAVLGLLRVEDLASAVRSGR
jgi:hypothetical protein